MVTSLDTRSTAGAREPRTGKRNRASQTTTPRRRGWKRKPIATVADRERVRRVLDQVIEFVPSAEFDAPACEPELLMSLAHSEMLLGRAPEPSKPRRRQESFLQRLDEVPLLTQIDEFHLFRAMNFLRSRAALVRGRLDHEWPQAELLDEIESAQFQADQIRNHIIRANLRLVVAVAKRYVDPFNSLADLVSDGNISLIRAVEKFDYSRGFRFSTYATWALRKNFHRSIGKQRLDRGRYVAAEDLISQVTANERAEQTTQQVLGKLRSTLDDILGRLEDRERSIVTARFGLDAAGHPHTLQEIADQMGICKERVRQLQARAMLKLQTFADEAKIEPPAN